MKCQSGRPVDGKKCNNNLNGSPAVISGNRICRECWNSRKWDPWWENSKIQYKRPHNLSKEQWKEEQQFQQKIAPNQSKSKIEVFEQ